MEIESLWPESLFHETFPSDNSLKKILERARDELFNKTNLSSFITSRLEGSCVVTQLSISCPGLKTNIAIVALVSGLGVKNYPVSVRNFKQETVHLHNEKDLVQMLRQYFASDEVKAVIFNLLSTRFK